MFLVILWRDYLTNTTATTPKKIALKWYRNPLQAKLHNMPASAWLHVCISTFQHMCIMQGLQWHMKLPKAVECGSHEMESGPTTVNISCSEDWVVRTTCSKNLYFLSVTPLQELIPLSVISNPTDSFWPIWIYYCHQYWPRAHTFPKYTSKEVSSWTRISWVQWIRA